MNKLQEEGIEAINNFCLHFNPPNWSHIPPPNKNPMSLWDVKSFGFLLVGDWNCNCCFSDWIPNVGPIPWAKEPDLWWSMSSIAEIKATDLGCGSSMKLQSGFTSDRICHLCDGQEPCSFNQNGWVSLPTASPRSCRNGGTSRQVGHSGLWMPMWLKVRFEISKNPHGDDPKKILKVGEKTT